MAIPELRFLPARHDIESETKFLVEEVILGPMNAESKLVSSSVAHVRSSIHAEKAHYIDISADFMFGGRNKLGVYASSPAGISEGLAYIKKNLAWNFPRITFIITMEGFQPDYATAVLAETQ